MRARAAPRGLRLIGFCQLDEIGGIKRMQLRVLWWCFVLGLLLVMGCRGGSQPPPTLDWMQGDWHGVRRDGADGSEAPITVHVVSLGGGPEHVERLQVQADGAPYVGFAVRSPSDPAGRWLMLYANSTRDSFSRLEGVVERDRVIWQSVTPGRTRESQVVMERLDTNRWRRTNRVSEDGGRTWRVLFTDDLERNK